MILIVKLYRGDKYYKIIKCIAWLVALIGLLFTLYTSAAKHYIDKYVFRVKLRVKAVYSSVLNSQQAVIYRVSQEEYAKLRKSVP